MFAFVSSYFNKYKVKLIIAVLLTFIIKIIVVLNPLIYSHIIDSITGNNNFDLLLHLTILLTGISLLNILLSYISQQLNLHIKTNIAFDMMKKLFTHIHKLQFYNINNINPAHLNEQINADTNSVSTFIVDIINSLIFNILTLSFVIFKIYKLNKMLSLYLLFICIIYLAIYVLLKNKIYDISFKLKEHQSTFFARMILQIEKVVFIRRNALSDVFLRNLDNDYNIYFDNIMKTQKFYYAYSSLENIITIISSFLIFVIAGKSVIQRNITIGEFTIIFSYFNMVLTNIKYFTSLGSQYQENLASYNRILDIYNMKIDIYHTEKIYDKTYEIEEISCENISFTRSEVKIIKNFTYSFSKGNSYCIYGNNGIGKTTLLDIIMGLYNDQYKGSIKYNHMDIKKLDMDNIRKYSISLLEQHTKLIGADIEENILLHKGYTKEELNKNTFNNLDDFFNISFEKELNDYINNISGGELQKVGILRLLSKKSSVFILDEPTNSLDQKSIKKLKDYIEHLKVNNIVILVNHDPVIIDACDYKIELS